MSVWWEILIPQFSVLAAHRGPVCAPQSCKRIIHARNHRILAEEESVHDTWYVPAIREREPEP
jgi:hypothetical protein